MTKAPRQPTTFEAISCRLIAAQTEGAKSAGIVSPEHGLYGGARRPIGSAPLPLIRTSARPYLGG